MGEPLGVVTESAWASFLSSDDDHTIVGYFCRATARHSERTFLRSIDGTAYTYGQAAVVVAQTMAQLQQLGLGPGDVAVSYMEETIPIVFFDLACALLRIIPAPVSHFFSVRYLHGVCDRLGAKLIVCSTENVETIASVGLPTACFAGESTNNQGWHRLELLPHWDAGRAAAYIAETRVACTPADAFMIQPTSGSTGLPKLVVRPHAAFARYAQFVGAELGDDDSEVHVFLAVQALTHAFGLHCLTTAIRLAAELVLCTDLDTNSLLSEVWALRPTVLPMVPRVLRSFYRQHLLELAAESNRPLFPPTARVVISAGGRSDINLLSYCSEQNLDIIEYYGSSEASIIALTPRNDWRPGFAGKLVADAELRITSDRELSVKSPGLMHEYFQDPEQNAEVMTADGYYLTGDCGEVVDDFVKIDGRKRDIFSTPEGSNIFPVRLEGLLEHMSWVRQAMLIGDGRPYLVAFIVIDDPELSSDEPDGYLPHESYHAVYRRVGPEITGINNVVERVEQIVYFALFTRVFPSECYQVVGQGKVARRRKDFEQLYKERIADMYSKVDFDHEPRRVPEADRRLRSSDRTPPDMRLVRAFPRIAAEGSCEIDDQGEAIFAAISNISLWGAQIACQRHFTNGHELRLKLHIAQVRLDLKAEVCWSSENLLGVRFREVAKEQQHEIEELIGRLGKTES